MQERAPRSAPRSAALLRPRAEVPRAPPVPVIERKESDMKLASVAVAIFCVAAFAGRVAAQESPRSDAKVGSTKWSVERVRCSDLLAASDDDRASAAMFYFGYLAAKENIHVIDVSKIDLNIGKVMKQCSATPNETVPNAFRQALRGPTQ